MNCADFNDELLEETLSAAARTHVLNCAACQQAWARQEALAKSIQLSVQRISIHPATKQRVLHVLQQQEGTPNTWVNIQAFWTALRRQPAWAGTILVCLLLLVFGSRFHQPARNSYVIDVPMENETHVYRSQNNKVVDAVVTEVTTINLQ